MAPSSASEVSEPFWSNQARDLCKKLWLPTETGFASSHSTCCNGCFSAMESKSWFTMMEWKESMETTKNLQRTCWPSSTFSTAESMAKGSTKSKTIPKLKMSRKKAEEPKPIKCKKYRLFPNPETRHVLRKWFGCVRKTYNLALGHLNKTQEKVDKYALRKQFVTAKNLPKSLSYLLDCPKHVRDGALDDLQSAFKTNFQKQKIDPDHRFQVKFRSKKDEQSIVIPPEAVKSIVEDKPQDDGNERERWSLTMYPTYIQNAIKIRVRKRDTMMTTISCECRLQLDRLGRFYLCVPYEACALDNQGGQAKLRHSWCSLDPGARTFQTVYSPSHGVCFKLAHGDVQRLFRLCLYLDKLISKTSKCTNKRSRRSHKKAQVRLRARIKHLVAEVHWKVALLLVRTFENIIIPKFETQSMVSDKRSRLINNVTARKLLTWSHYTFRRRLEEKAKEHASKVWVVTEEYTTKTCGHCLKINHCVGGSKVFRCRHCGITADRDVNGSRNVFLKNVTCCDNKAACDLGPCPCLATA